MTRRNDPVVIRKLAIDDLAHEFDVGEPEAHLIGQQIDSQFRLVVLEQFTQLEHRLARKNHLLTGIASRDHQACIRQAMPVGGNGLQRPVVHDQQHAVEVIADVLLRHGEFGEFEKPAEIPLRKLDRLLLFLRETDAGIVRGRQCL